MPSTTLNFQFYKWVKAGPRQNRNFTIIKKLKFSQLEICGIIRGMQRKVFLMNKQNLYGNSYDQSKMTGADADTINITINCRENHHPHHPLLDLAVLWRFVIYFTVHYNAGAGRISYHYYVDFQHLNDGLCVVSFTTGTCL